jgi:hypothetical protein
LQGDAPANSLSPSNDESLKMIHSDATIRNQLPASSQGICVDVIADGDDCRFDSETASEMLASRNALLGCNLDSLAHASYRQKSSSSRSDVDLNVRMEVERRLRTSFHAEFHGANCDIHEGTLVLSGNVSNFHAKQLAQEIARKVDGVKFIVNRLHVDQSHLSKALRTDVPFHSIHARE